MSTKQRVVIVGAGMAGASLGAAIARDSRLTILERESQPGYHATGRSAAFWAESYGGPLVQPLTTASGPFLAEPSPDFHDAPFLSPRGAISLADADGEFSLHSTEASLRSAGVTAFLLDRNALTLRIPGLREGWTQGVFEPSCSDIDVAALHAAYLRRARRDGAEIVTDAQVVSISRARGTWSVVTAKGDFAADVLVNASGAWADELATMAGVRPLGIQPYRRTMVQLRVQPPVPRDLPLVIDALGRFYFKPDQAGRLWLSPHDESACDPCDAAPEELDVALAIERLSSVVDWKVETVEHSWAGLRSFAPDRLPVYGFDPFEAGFFWCVGQGGFGIQTAPAAAELAASLLLGREAQGPGADIDPRPYSASRFAN